MTIDDLTEERRAVLDVLREAGGKIGPGDVHERLDTESSYASVKNLLSDLVRDGFAWKPGHGQYVYLTDTPGLPGGGPGKLGHLEDGAVPNGILIVLDFGEQEVHVPVSVLGQGHRVGPPIRATARVVASDSLPTAHTAV